MSRSSVPWRWAECSRSARLRIDIRPEYAYPPGRMSTQKRRDEDFTREIRAHIEIETARLIEEGMPPERGARRRPPGVRQRHPRARSGSTNAAACCGSITCGRTSAARSATSATTPSPRSSPCSRSAGGIGATTVTLTVRDVIFRKAPPLYREPAQLSRVQIGTPDRPIMPIGSAVPAGSSSSWRDVLRTRRRRRGARARPRERADRRPDRDRAGATLSRRSSSPCSASRPRWAAAVAGGRTAGVAAGRSQSSRCGSGCSTRAPTPSARSSGSTTSPTPSPACCRARFWFADDEFADLDAARSQARAARRRARNGRPAAAGRHAGVARRRSFRPGSPTYARRLPRGRAPAAAEGLGDRGHAARQPDGASSSPTCSACRCC